MTFLGKKTLIILALTGVTLLTFADRGAGKKSKVKTNLNITTSAVSLKASILSSIKNGMAYKGSMFTNRKVVNNVVVNNSLLTYQKGNTTYIIPYKNKVTVPEMKQGYAGVKLIIRSKK